MIWRILGTIGAASFFFTGFAVLADPECVSADIGGGRIVGVTCRSDSYGAFTGGSAGLIMLLIGTALLIFIYWNAIQRYLGGNNMRRELTPKSDFRSSSESRIRTTSYKTCDKCGKEMEAKWGHCPVCLGTTFTHKQRELKPFEFTPEEMSPDISQTGEPILESVTPEFKDCPMCAEQIKFAAKKCRYCSSLI